MRMLRSLWNRLERWSLGGGRSPWRRALLSLLLLGPALAFIAYQTWRNWEQLRQYEWQVRPAFWALAFAGYTVALFCLLAGWNRIMGRLGGVTHFRKNARLYLLSGLSKRLPGFVWYMLSRALLYKDEGVPAPVSLAGSALELALLMTSGLLAYFLILPFLGQAFLEGPRLLLLLALLLLGAVLLQPAVFNRILRFFLRRLGSSVQVEVTYRDLWPLLPLYLFAWGVGGIVLYVTARSVYPLPLVALPTTMSIWAAAGTLALGISSFLIGTGVREITLTFFLTAVLPQPLAVVVALLFWLLYVLFELTWTGLVSLWR